jgi:hypothetical protein
LCKRGAWSGPLLDLHDGSDVSEVLRPLTIGSVAAEQSLDIGAVAIIHRLEDRDRLAPTDDGEALATVLYGVEKVGEAPRRLGGCDLRHPDQILRLLGNRWVPGPSGACAPFIDLRMAYKPRPQLYGTMGCMRDTPLTILGAAT